MRFLFIFCIVAWLSAIAFVAAGLSAERAPPPVPADVVLTPIPATQCDGPLCVVPGLIVPYTEGSNRPIARKPVAKPVRKLIKRTVKRVDWHPRWRTRRFFQRSRTWRPLRGGGCCG